MLERLCRRSNGGTTRRHRRQHGIGILGEAGSFAGRARGNGLAEGIHLSQDKRTGGEKGVGRGQYSSRKWRVKKVRHHLQSQMFFTCRADR